jgi:hypothetical protein
MVTNGTLEEKVITGGGVDPTTGDPIAVTSSYSTAVPCYIKVNKRNNMGVNTGGSFTLAQYEILIPSQIFTTKTIRLKDARSTVLGEFEVQSIEFLDKVQRVKITV